MLHLQKQFVYLPIAFVNVTQIFVKLTFVAMIKNRQQNFLLNQQISFCSVQELVQSKTHSANILLLLFPAFLLCDCHILYRAIIMNTIYLEKYIMNTF